MPATAAVVHSDPQILGGTPVFVGTRVPVKTLYEYLEAGDSLDEFLNDFPMAHAFVVYGGSRDYHDGKIRVLPIAVFLRDLVSILANR